MAPSCSSTEEQKFVVSWLLCQTVSVCICCRLIFANSTNYLQTTVKLSSTYRQTTVELVNLSITTSTDMKWELVMAEQKGIRQIPIVCPGHTRPLAELQFLHVKEENRTLLVSACHGTWWMKQKQSWSGTMDNQGAYAVHWEEHTLPKVPSI